MRIHLETSDNLILRRLHSEDIAQVENILTRAFNSAPLGAKAARRMQYYCVKGNDNLLLSQQETDDVPTEYWVIEQESSNTIIGISGLYSFAWAWEKLVWLHWFAVDPQLQGRGYGTVTLQVVMQIARAKGCEIIKVETDADGRAANLYKRLGFVEEARLSHYYSSEANAMILSRDLSDITPLKDR